MRNRLAAWRASDTPLTISKKSFLSWSAKCCLICSGMTVPVVHYGEAGKPRTYWDGLHLTVVYGRMFSQLQYIHNLHSTKEMTSHLRTGATY